MLEPITSGVNTPSRYFEAADAERASLRSAVAAVDHFIAHLPNTQAGSDQGITAAWAALKKLLALGAAREVRDCPVCGQVAIRDATRCGHCWSRLTPLAPSLDGRQQAGGIAES